MHKKNNPRKSHRSLGCSLLANPDLAPNVHSNSSEAFCTTTAIITTADNAIRTKQNTPSSQKAEASCIREKLQLKGLSNNTIAIFVASWRVGTQSQYQSMILRWLNFSAQQWCDYLSPQLSFPMNFLSEIFNLGLSYSSINTARSALSSISYLDQDYVPFGQLPIVTRYMKEIFKLRPSFQRYKSIWNVNIAFNYIRTRPDLQALGLKDISKRVVFLLCLLSGQRCQTLCKLLLTNMSIEQDKYVFDIQDKLRHTRSGR